MLKAWKIVLAALALLLAASSGIPAEAAADRVINVRSDYHGGGYGHYPRGYYRPYPRPYPYYRPYYRPYPYRYYYPRYYYRFSPYPYYYFPLPPAPPYPFYPGW